MNTVTSCSNEAKAKNVKNTITNSSRRPFSFHFRARPCVVPEGPAAAASASASPRVSGTRTHVAMALMRAIAAAPKNGARRPPAQESSAPIAGPTVKPIPNAAPIIPINAARRRGGAMSATDA